ncbi:hypothetical protein ACQCVO_12220 [Bacillus infantis]|uniref:hypothetical protein n=1 Tax=Bacillus infantis TaxID=324767 RepID=UPI003CECBDA3
MAMAEGNFLWITGLKWVADIQTIKGFHGTYILLLFNDIIYLRFMTKTKHMEYEMKSKIITSFSLAYSVQLASAFSLTTSQLMIFVSAAAFLLFGIGLLIKKFSNKNN